MIDALKKFDKKFLVTCGLLIIIPLFIIILLAILRSCEGGSNNFKTYQNKMVSYAEKYFDKHKLLPSDGKEAIATLEELETDGLKSSSKALKDDSCTGSVTVKNNNGEFIYFPYLECGDYKTEYLTDKLKKQVVDKESGLYKIGNEYIFKGNKVNNYVSFYGTLYHIIKIDENNTIRMIKVNSEDDQISWDTKYNVSERESIGINNYYNSYIYDYLWKTYNNPKKVSDDMKRHIVAHTVCLDKKSENDLNIHKDKCTDELKKQYISLPSLYDYALASYDENCKQLGDGSCANFNYLKDDLSTSWTTNASSDDTYSVYYISGYGVETANADTYVGFHWIIYISGNEIVEKGTGTLDDPFIIK